MRKIVYKMFIIMILFICSLSLISCEAITAQNITNTGSAQGMNGGPGVKGNQGANGNPGMNGNQGMGGNKGINEMKNADLMGKIISVDGNSIKIELVEQTQNNKSSNSNDGKQDVKNNNNKQSQRGVTGNMSDMNYTGVEKTITVNDDVNISQGQSMGRQNGNDTSKSSIKVSDLKKDQIIMIWYKENTETVERISVVQS